MAKLRLAQANGRSNINVIRTPSKAGRGFRAMLSKTATYWAAGLGVAAFAAATPFILQYYHLWPGAVPAPLVAQEPPSAPPTPAPAGPTAAPAPPAQAAAATPSPTAQPTPQAQTPAPAPNPPQAAAPPAVALNEPAPAPSAPAAPRPPAAAPAAVASDQPAHSAAAPAPSTQAKAEQRPAFDVVRVEPTGDAVIAGRASPRAAVQLRSDGRVVAQVDADEAGQFAILPPPFSAGGHRLQLAARTGGSPEVLSDAIGIDVPTTAADAAPPSAPTEASPANPQPAAPAQRAAEAARAPEAAPAKPNRPMEAAKTPAASQGTKVAGLGAAATSSATPQVSFLSVEASGTGRFEAKGAAAPNALVRLYLNNAFLAEATAGQDGRWSLIVERGMTPGAYAIRADEIDRASGAVAARAEVPFDYPERRPAAAEVAAAPQAPEKPAPMKAPDQPAASAETLPEAPLGKATSSAVAAATPAQAPPTAESPSPAPPKTKESAAVSGGGAALAQNPASGVSNAAPARPRPSVPTAPSPAVSGGAAPPAQNRPSGVSNGAPAGPGPSAPAAQSPAVSGGAAPPAQNRASGVSNLASAGPGPSAPAAQSPAVVASAPANSDGANPVVAEIRTTKVVRGDNLWNLSKHFYGYGPEYKVI